MPNLCVAVAAIGLVAPGGSLSAAIDPCVGWQPEFGLKQGVDGVVRGLVQWDPDGAGPADAMMVAGGGFIKAGGLTVNRLVGWDGSDWRPLGSGIGTSLDSRQVRALTLWNPDGAAVDSIIAAVNLGVWKWNGASWASIGSVSGLASTPYAVTTWDADSAGPAPQRLVVAGSFANIGGVSGVNGVGAWDGSTWQALGTGVTGVALAATSWDPDGPGPAGTLLVVAGSLTAAGGAPVNSIAAWDGSAWQALGSGLSTTVHALTTFDFDGDGPAPAELVAGGYTVSPSTDRVALLVRWDGSAWRDVGPDITSGPTTLPIVNALGRWDPDGPGPAVTRLVVGGEFTMAGAVAAGGTALLGPSGWEACGPGAYGVNAVSTWDPDGPGPASEVLAAGGGFGEVGGEWFASVGTWDGRDWVKCGYGLSHTTANAGVKDACTWDPDGDGPETARLVVGGSFKYADGTLVNRVASWDGAGWSALGIGTDGSQPGVYSVCSFDRDGAGPAPARLIAGGPFAKIGGLDIRGIASWNGTAWSGLGAGVGGPTGASVNALAAWDPDDAGPLPTMLVAGGSFTAIGGSTANRVALWDGFSWSPLGAGFNQAVTSLAVFDADGAGPGLSALIAAGQFSLSGATALSRIARWTGSAWESMGAGFDGTVESLAVYRPGGAAGPAVLVAGGAFLHSGSTDVRRIAWYDGAAWQPMGGGSATPVLALHAFDPEGHGASGGDRLYAGGQFVAPAGRFDVAQWDGSSWVAVEGFFDFAATTLASWAVGGQRSVVVGGDFETLREASGVDRPVTYLARLASCCPADVSGDGVVDFGDYLEFLNLYDTLDVRADFNGDGVVDFADYLEFLNLYDAGC